MITKPQTSVLSAPEWVRESERGRKRCYLCIDAKFRSYLAAAAHVLTLSKPPNFWMGKEEYGSSVSGKFVWVVNWE